MKFYTAPYTCAVGIHLLLEEIGQPFTVQTISTRDGEQHGPAFQAINPKGKVPVLQRHDGSVLTEFGAIALWLAETHPRAGLIGTDAESRARALEAISYVTGTLHAQGFARVFRAERFAPNEQESVKKIGRGMAARGLEIVGAALEEREYVTGQFGIADAALFYVENWGFDVGIALPDNITAHRLRMRDRPAVQRALAAVPYDR